MSASKISAADREGDTGTEDVGTEDRGTWARGTEDWGTRDLGTGDRGTGDTCNGGKGKGDRVTGDIGAGDRVSGREDTGGPGMETDITFFASYGLSHFKNPSLPHFFFLTWAANSFDTLRSALSFIGESRLSLPITSITFCRLRWTFS